MKIIWTILKSVLIGCGIVGGIYGTYKFAISVSTVDDSSGIDITKHISISDIFNLEKIAKTMKELSENEQKEKNLNQNSENTTKIIENTDKKEEIIKEPKTEDQTEKDNKKIAEPQQETKTEEPSKEPKIEEDAIKEEEKEKLTPETTSTIETEQKIDEKENKENLEDKKEPEVTTEKIQTNKEQEIEKKEEPIIEINTEDSSETSTNTSNSVVIYMVSENFDDSDWETETLTQNSNNFTCKTNHKNNSKIFDCQVHEWEDTNINSKKHYQLSDIENYLKKIPTRETLKKSNKIFKVEFDKQHKPTDINTRIEIISKTQTDNNKKYSKLKQWINKGEPIKAKNVIGKLFSNTTNIKTINIDNSSNSTKKQAKCKLENINKQISCKIWEFSTEKNQPNPTSSYSSLTFNESSIDPSTIIKGQYYLINLGVFVNTKQSNSQTLNYVENNSNGETIIFKNLESAIIRGGKLFII